MTPEREARIKAVWARVRRDCDLSSGARFFLALDRLPDDDILRPGRDYLALERFHAGQNRELGFRLGVDL
jgi:hypothetical protein